LNLLGGSEEFAEGERCGRNPRIGEQKEEMIQNMELEEDEIKKAVLKKLKKAVGIDGIPMEAWRYGSVMVKIGLIEILGKA